MSISVKKIHFIGICGVGMGALAIAMKKAGYQVTGSDVGFFPPISTHLQKNKIDFYPGWHFEKVLANFTNGGKKDEIVVVGNVASSTNPEWQYVQEHRLNYLSYPELIAKFFIKKNSIVCAGTYGKTSTTALLSWILREASYSPSYMFGGLAVDEDFESASLGKNEEPRKTSSTATSTQSRGNYSVVEGDEYKTARWDNSPKFSHYSPTHLLLTAVEWDHADVYPTEELYISAFQKLIDSVPKDGMILVSERLKDSRLVPSVVEGLKIKDYLTYGELPTSDYYYSNLIQSKDGIQFNIHHQSLIFNLQSLIFGSYNAENITAAFAMAHQIGIDPDKIISAIKSFKGLKRRLEKRLDGKIIVFDDIAHSPTKVKSVLKTLKQIYKMTTVSKIIAVFEPNTGNRQIESIPSYDHAFIDADEVIIPELTKIKIDPNDPQQPIDGQQLTEVISKTHSNAKYIGDDAKLVEYLVNNSKAGDVIVFLGSHGFRGMIDEVVSKIKHKQNP